MTSGEPYPSGTAYEVLTAIEQSRETGRPSVYLFRKTSDAPVAIGDADKLLLFNEQLARLKAFWERYIKTPDGPFKAGYQEFSTPDEFEAQLEVCCGAGSTTECSGAAGGVAARASRARRSGVLPPLAPGMRRCSSAAATSPARWMLKDARRAVIPSCADRLERFGQVLAGARRSVAAADHAGRGPRGRSMAGCGDAARRAKGEPVLALATRLFDSSKDIPPRGGAPRAAGTWHELARDPELAVALAAGDAASGLGARAGSARRRDNAMGTTGRCGPI